MLAWLLLGTAIENKSVLVLNKACIPFHLLVAYLFLHSSCGCSWQRFFRGC